MKLKTLSMLLATLMLTFALAACDSAPKEEAKSAPAPAPVAEEKAEAPAPAPAPAEVKGFAADAVIGVSLPWLGTQNWKEAEVMFKAELEKAGFKPIIQAADNKVPQQQQQIESMIQNGAEVIVVGPIDGTQLGTVLDAAKAEGIEIIGYDRLIENTASVDGVVQYGSFKTGVAQGNALLAGLKEVKGEGPYNIELFAGGPADPNAPLFFEGAMSVLQPEIDKGNLIINSGQTEFTQVATADWDNSKAQARMDSILSGFYSDKEIDGALSPNDGIARAIITSCEFAGQPLPVTSGLDAENESIEWIWNGKQYSTVAKPTNLLVGLTVDLIEYMQQGVESPIRPTATANNGVIEVDLYELDPVAVTKANIQEVFADDPSRLELLK